jgi:hypothetical protein
MKACAYALTADDKAKLRAQGVRWAEDEPLESTHGNCRRNRLAALNSDQKARLVAREARVRLERKPLS